MSLVDNFTLICRHVTTWLTMLQTVQSSTLLCQGKKQLLLLLLWSSISLMQRSTSQATAIVASLDVVYLATTSVWLTWEVDRCATCIDPCATATRIRRIHIVNIHIVYFHIYIMYIIIYSSSSVFSGTFVPVYTWYICVCVSIPPCVYLPVSPQTSSSVDR